MRIPLQTLRVRGPFLPLTTFQVVRGGKRRRWEPFQDSPPPTTSSRRRATRCLILVSFCKTARCQFACRLFVCLYNIVAELSLRTVLLCYAFWQFSRWLYSSPAWSAFVTLTRQDLVCIGSSRFGSSFYDQSYFQQLGL